ncbi:MAG: hypothetical protein HFJ26_07295 [Clostridia bacterium]|nr:hypothetical protein [Clostridia bacterium]
MERRIEVRKAGSNYECIQFYSNKAPDWYCKGKIIDEEKVEIKWENGKDSLRSANMKQKIIAKLGNFYVSRILNTCLKLCIIILFITIDFAIFLIANQIEYLARHICEVIATILGSSFLITEIFNYALDFLVARKYRTSKYCAMTKIINVLEKLQRLPNDLEEIKKMTAFSESYGSYEDEQEWSASAKSILNGISLIVAAGIVFLLEMSFQTTFIVLVLIFLVLKMILQYFLLEYLTSKMRAFSQRKFIENEPEEDDLLLAWIVAKEWMKEEYPEYFQED